jgi:hypothetical protein
MCLFIETALAIVKVQGSIVQAFSLVSLKVERKVLQTQL